MAGSGWRKGAARKAAFALGTASLLALTACATTQNSAYDDYGDRYASGDVGPDRLYRQGHFRDTRPEAAEMYAVLSRPVDNRVMADFEGIEGARRAHQMFPAQMAEKFDGACEREVQLNRGENIYDVAELCDVSVSMIVDENYPRYKSAKHIGGGDWVKVPQVPNPERAAFMQGYATNSVFPASAYVVQPGDTLNGIAAKHLSSPAAVATLNQNVNWQYLRVGDTVWIPSAIGSAPVSAAPYAAPPMRPGATTGSLPYNYAGHARSGGVIGVMPYQLTPAQAAAERNAPRDVLTLNARFVNPGQEVVVEGRGLPRDSDITIYRGPNGRDGSRSGPCGPAGRGSLARRPRCWTCPTGARPGRWFPAPWRDAARSRSGGCRCR